ncbi:MAG TPA: hypothetical protein VGT07_02215 [Steroidobacteraceae bacterium]|nr:hypothetical protein [Steroidobacteraceae bacterium]
MNASQKVTAAAMALIITLTGSIVVTAPMTLPGFSPASSLCDSCRVASRSNSVPRDGSAARFGDEHGRK